MSVDKNMLDRKIPRKLTFLFALEENFPPFRVDTTVLFAHEIVAKGYQVTWLFETEDPEIGSGWQQWQGGVAKTIFTGQGHSLFDRVRRNLRSFLVDIAIVPTALRGEYDFIQVKDRFIGGVVGLFMAKLTGARFFFWLSFPYPELYAYKVTQGQSTFPLFDVLRSRWLKLILYKIICRFADHVFVQSDQMQKDIEAEGVPADKMTPVPMCISLDRLEEFSVQSWMRRKNKKPTLVYLGTLSRDRKLDFLVRVLTQVNSTYGDVILKFVGGGDTPADEQVIWDEARKWGVEDRIVITGFMPWQDAWQHVVCADVCLSPYYPTPILNSTSPTKLIEYMALEKPVVANDHPDQRLVIEQSGGGYCVPWDEEAFAEAICLLLQDPDGAIEMGKRGASYVKEKRSYRYCGDELAKTYARLCVA